MTKSIKDLFDMYERGETIVLYNVEYSYIEMGDVSDCVELKKYTIDSITPAKDNSYKLTFRDRGWTYFRRAVDPASEIGFLSEKEAWEQQIVAYEDYMIRKTKDFQEMASIVKHGVDNCKKQIALLDT